MTEEGRSPPVAAIARRDSRTSRPSLLRERLNWLIYALYVRHDFADSLRVIEEVLKESRGLCEYAIFVKGLNKRLEGRVHESLSLFQAAACLNPQALNNLKQVAKSLYLLGRHRAALDVYEEAQRIEPEDWATWHHKGLCHVHLRQYNEAVVCFENANSIHRHDATFHQLGRVHALRDDFRSAIDVYSEALEFNPDSADLLAVLGIYYLRLGDTAKAFEHLGNALTIDPRKEKAILAAGSIIQDHGDTDVALRKYRVAAQQTPHSAQLWSNVGMCFFHKEKFVAAAACLKRALYLDPFEWIIAHNLGLVHLRTGQYASAFHYLSASINIKPDFPPSYHYLAIALSKLDDFANACHAFDKALEHGPDLATLLNYAITLHRHGATVEAKQKLSAFDAAWGALDSGIRASETGLEEQRSALHGSLYGVEPPSVPHAAPSAAVPPSAGDADPPSPGL
ncbi:unnamed protein product [Vitrella brassicaformis CCMP3155]|uniref:Uncharacterized protein n=2 Tax=Vitrella brassicaformis TaxID=1169539 RepID=A0A0G4EJP9_VITBC|nr:unnamed protein product [Vitrella brassicaformis CCMP3155]|eukprot:CEL97655.1 unnamed protein product [Vitrella brassicaformis CCMP3155]